MSLNVAKTEIGHLAKRFNPVKELVMHGLLLISTRLFLTDSGHSNFTNVGEWSLLIIFGVSSLVFVSVLRTRFSKMAGIVFDGIYEKWRLSWGRIPCIFERECLFVFRMLAMINISTRIWYMQLSYRKGWLHTVWPRANGLNRIRQDIESPPTCVFCNSASFLSSK